MSKSSEIVQIEEIYKGLTDVDTTLNKIVDSCLRVVKASDDVSRSFKEGAVSLENITKLQKQTNDELKQKETIDKNLVASEQKLKDIQSGSLNEEIKRKIAIQQTTQETKNKISFENAAAGSIEKLIAHNKLLYAEQRKLNLETVEGAKRNKEINDTINKNTDTIKANSSELVKNKMNVGNYTQSILEAYKSMPGPIGRAATTVQGFHQTMTKVNDILKGGATNVTGFGKKASEATQVLNEFGQVTGNAAAKAATEVKGFAATTTAGMATAEGATLGFGATLKAVGKTILTTPIGWLVLGITALVAILGGLFHAFKSTDEGAVKIAGVFKGLKNIVDILVDRLASFGKLIWSILRLDFKDIKKNGEAAFGGLAKQLEETFKAGQTYAETIDDIKDRQSAAGVRAATLRNEIEKLTNQMRMKVADDGTIQSVTKRIELSQTLMAKEKELNLLEKSFAEETTQAEVKNLASKIAIDGMTIESKQALLEKWLLIDDKQLDSEKKKDAAFADFYNKNEDDIQKLQKMKAEDIAKDGDFERETRRIQISAASFRKELLDEAKKDQEDATKKRLDNAESANNKEIGLINKRHLSGSTSDAQYQQELMDQEKKYAKEKVNIYEKGSKEYEAAFLDIQKKEIDSENKTHDLLLKTKQDLLTATAQNSTDQYAREKQAENARFENRKADLQKELIVKNRLSADEMKINDNINQTIEQEQLSHNIKLGEINLKQKDEHLKNINAGYAEQFAALDDELKKEEITIEQYNERKKALEESSGKALIDFRKKYGIQGESGLEDEIKLFQSSKEFALLTEEEKQIGLKKIKEKFAKEDKDRAKELHDMEIDFAAEVVNGIFKLNASKLDQQMSDLEKERNAKLDNEHLTAKQKDKINAEFDKKAAVIKTKQAKAEKLQALFNIAVNTAVSATKAAASLPPPLNVPLIAMAIAQGLIQAALVAAQPIPKFAKGTESAPIKGIFGESGRELMELKSGAVALAEKPTYFEGNKFLGAKIYPNKETEKMMKMADFRSTSTTYQMSDQRIINSLNSVEKAIRNKPVMIYDKDYRPIGQGNSNHQDVYLNRLLRN